MLDYSDPVVVAQISSFEGPDPCHIRIRDVTGDRIGVEIEEWSYLDGRHAFEDLTIAVVEAGQHRLPNGWTIDAGKLQVDSNWTAATFSAPMPDPPIVFSQCMTRAGPDPVVTRQRDVSPTGFDVRLQEEEALGPHVAETVGWIAIG